SSVSITERNAILHAKRPGGEMAGDFTHVTHSDAANRTLYKQREKIRAENRVDLADRQTGSAGRERESVWCIGIHAKSELKEVLRAIVVGVGEDANDRGVGDPRKIQDEPVFEDVWVWADVHSDIRRHLDLRVGSK